MILLSGPSFVEVLPTVPVLIMTVVGAWVGPAMGVAEVLVLIIGLVASTADD